MRGDDWRRVLLFAAAAVLIGTYWSLTAAVADTLFLSRLAAEGRAVVRWLPWVYVLVAAGGVAGTWSFGAAQQWFARRVVLVAAPVVLATVVIALRWALALNALWMRLALSVLGDVGGLLSLMIFFSVAGDFFSTREGKRLYGRIGAGLPLGVLAGGALVAPLTAALGLENVLYVAGALLLGTAAAYIVAYWRMASISDSGPAEADAAASRTPAARPFARWLAWLSFLTPILFVCADLPMKWLVSTRAPSDMAHFFGAFYIAVGVAELVVQLAAARVIMSVLGMNNALLLFPVLVGGACAVLAAAPTLAAAAAASFLRAVIGETIESQARELHWLAVPARLRHRLQPWASGALAPLGQGAAGLGLAALAVFGWYRAAPVAGVATAIVIIIVVRRLAPLHLRALTDALRYHHLDERAMGRLLRTPGMRAVAASLLASPDPAVARVTRELLDGSSNESRGPVEDDTDPARVGIVMAASAARRLVARGIDAPSDVAEQVRRTLDRMELVHRGRAESNAFLAPILDDHLRMQWDLFLSLCAFQSDSTAYDRVRRNLWTSSHSEALDLLDALLPPAIAGRALPLATPRRGVGSGFSRTTRERLAAAGPWLEQIASYGEPGTDGRLIDDTARMRALPLFTGVAADLLVPIASRATSVDVRAGEVIFDEASVADAVYVILDGMVELSVDGMQVATLGPGESLGELGALDGARRSAGAAAASECRLLRIPVDALRDALATEAALVEALLRSVSSRLRATQPTEAPDETSAASGLPPVFMHEDSSLTPLMKRTAFLRDVPLFRGVSVGYAAALARLMQAQPIVAGEVVFAAGDPGDALYVVESGQLSVRIGDRRIATLGPGNFVGEMALLDGAPRSASVVVDESGCLLRIGASDFANLIATTPAIGVELFRELATRLRAATRDARRERESSIGRA